MERHPEVVAAAEALRTWVRAQRATWPDVDDRASAQATAARVPPMFGESGVAFAERAGLEAGGVGPEPRAHDFEPVVPAAPVFAPAEPIFTPAAAVFAPAEPGFTPAAPVFTPAEPGFTPAEPVFTPTEGFALDAQSDSLLDAPSQLPSDPAAFPRLTVPSVAAQAPDATGARSRIPWSRLRDAGVRVAAVLAVVAVLAAAASWGRAAWQRQASAPRTGTLRLVSVQGPAEVIIDDTPMGTTPLELTMAAGRHTVLFRRQRATRTLQVDVVKGESTQARVDWNPKRFGGLQIESTPSGAKVSVDGKVFGTTPVTLDDLPVGTHTLVLESSAGTVRRRVQVVEGQTEVVNESIFSGWLRVSSAVDLVVSENGKPLRLDSSGRVLVAPGHHVVRLENAALGIAEVREFDVEPGATATVSVDTGESTLTVTASTDAEVTIDGVRLGRAPVTQGAVRVGRHEVIAVDASGSMRRRTVRVTSQPTEVHIDFSQR